MAISFPIDPHETGRARRRALREQGLETKALGANVGSLARTSTARFDPNAEDGDGDGLVQDSTPFERPAVLSNIAGIRRGLSSSSGANPLFSSGASRTKGMTNREVAEYAVPDTAARFVEMKIELDTLTNFSEPLLGAAANYTFIPSEVESLRGLVERTLDRRPALRVLIDKFGIPPIVFYPNLQMVGSAMETVGASYMRVGDSYSMPGFPLFGVSRAKMIEALDPLDIDDKSLTGQIATDAEATLVHEYGHYLNYLVSSVHPDAAMREFAQEWWRDDWRTTADRERELIARIGRKGAETWRIMSSGPRHSDNAETIDTPGPDVPYVSSMYAHTMPAEFFAEAFTAYFDPDPNVRQKINPAARNLVERMTGVQAGLASRVTRYRGGDYSQMTPAEIADLLVPDSRDEAERLVREWFEIFSLDSFEAFLAGPVEGEAKDIFGGLDAIDFSPEAVATNRAIITRTLSENPMFLEAVRMYGLFPVMSTKKDVLWDDDGTMAVTGTPMYPMIVLNSRSIDELLEQGRVVPDWIREDFDEGLYLDGTRDFLVARTLDGMIVHEFGHQMAWQIFLTHPEQAMRTLASYWNRDTWDELKPSLFSLMMSYATGEVSRKKTQAEKELVENLRTTRRFARKINQGGAEKWTGHPHVMSGYAQSSPAEMFAEAVAGMLMNDPDGRSMVSPRMRNQVSMMLGMPEIVERPLAGGEEQGRMSAGLASRTVTRAPDGARVIDAQSWSPLNGSDWLKDATIDEMVEAVVPTNVDDMINFAVLNYLTGVDPATVPATEMAEVRAYIEAMITKVSPFSSSTTHGQAYFPYDFSPAGRDEVKRALKDAIQQSPEFEWALRTFGTMPIIAVTQDSIDDAQKNGIDTKSLGVSGGIMGVTTPFHITLDFSSSLMAADLPFGYFPGYPSIVKLPESMDTSTNTIGSVDRRMGVVNVSRAGVLIHEWAHGLYRKLSGPRRFFGSRALAAQIGASTVSPVATNTPAQRAAYYAFGRSVVDAEQHLKMVRDMFADERFMLGPNTASRYIEMLTELAEVETHRTGIPIGVADIVATKDFNNGRRAWNTLTGTSSSKPNFIAKNPVSGFWELNATHSFGHHFAAKIVYEVQKIADLVDRAAIASGKSPSEAEADALFAATKMRDYFISTYDRMLLASAYGITPWHPKFDEEFRNDFYAQLPYAKNGQILDSELTFFPQSVYAGTNRQELFAESMVMFMTPPNSPDNIKQRNKYLPPEAEAAIAWALGLKPDTSVGTYAKPWEYGATGITEPDMPPRIAIVSGIPTRSVAYPVSPMGDNADRNIVMPANDTPGVNTANVGGYTFDYLDADLNPDAGYVHSVEDFDTVRDFANGMYGNGYVTSARGTDLYAEISSGDMVNAPDWAKRDAERAVNSAHSLLKEIETEDSQTDNFMYGSIAGTTDGIVVGDTMDIPLMSMAGSTRNADTDGPILRLAPGASAYMSPLMEERLYGEEWRRAPIEAITSGRFRVTGISEDNGRKIIDIEHVGVFDTTTRSIRDRGSRPRTDEMGLRSTLVRSLNDSEYMKLRAESEKDPAKRSMYEHLSNESLWVASHASNKIASGDNDSFVDELTVPRQIGLSSRVPLEDRARRHGVSLDVFSDESMDDDDVMWSSNDWSISKDSPVQAGDVVVVRNDKNGKKYVLGVSRKNGPFRGAFSLPGGMREGNEDLYESAEREMFEEVNIDPRNTSSKKLLGQVDARDWDPRFVEGGRVAGVRFDVTDEVAQSVRAGDDAEGFNWIDVEELSSGKYPIAFGHAAWLAEAFADDPVLGPRFLVLAEASRVRNQRLISKIDEVRRRKGAKEFGTLPEPNEPYTTAHFGGLRSSSRNVRLRPQVTSGAARTLRDWTESLDEDPAYSNFTRENLTGDWAREMADKLENGRITHDEAMNVMSALVEIIHRETISSGSGPEKMNRLEIYNKLARRLRRDITDSRPRVSPTDANEEENIELKPKPYDKWGLRSTTDVRTIGTVSARPVESLESDEFTGVTFNSDQQYGLPTDPYSTMRVSMPVYSVGGKKIAFGNPQVGRHKPELGRDVEIVPINPYLITNTKVGSEEGEKYALLWFSATIGFNREVESGENDEGNSGYTSALLYAASRGDEDALRELERLADVGEKAMDNGKNEYINWVAQNTKPKYGDGDIDWSYEYPEVMVTTGRKDGEPTRRPAEVDDMFVVHQTSFMPEIDENGDMIIRPAEDHDVLDPQTGLPYIDPNTGMEGRNHRGSIHFAINHLVEGHMFRPTPNKKTYVVLAPLGTVLDGNPGSLDVLYTVDTVMTPPPNGGLVFRRGTYRIMELPGLDEVGYSMPEGSSFDWSDEQRRNHNDAMTRLGRESERIVLRNLQEISKEINGEDYEFRAFPGGMHGSSEGVDKRVRAVAAGLGVPSMKHDGTPHYLFEGIVDTSRPEERTVSMISQTPFRAMWAFSRNARLRFANNNRWTSSAVKKKQNEATAGLFSRSGSMREKGIRGNEVMWVSQSVVAFLADAPEFDIKTLNYTKPDLRERLKREIMAGSDGGKPGQWSARKAQLLAMRYRKAGGGYRGGLRKTQRSLKRWTRQKWTTSDGKPAIRKGGTRRYLPASAWRSLTPAQRAATNRKKVIGSRKGNQFVRNTEAAENASRRARD